MAQHHSLDLNSIPEKTLYVNETDLADLTVLDDYPPDSDSSAADNVRICVPLDLNQHAIIRRLRDIYMRYGDLVESNERNFAQEVGRIVAQLEIYDQIWFARKGDSGNGHSRNSTELVLEIIAILEENEGCAELFPYEVIEELKSEYKLN